ncbi:hypothetical protein [Prevotella merdae]|uniref:hypothetical protein n=1 Tax=Prevotella merdae TaxID=2079531 RepID=UPI00356272AD
MSDVQLQNIVDIIHKCHTWIDVGSSFHWKDTAVSRHGTVQTVCCRCLTLRACHSNNDYVRGQEWHIPLLDIDRSAKILMRKDAGFKKRLASNALTMADVELLFMEVTYGIIELELFEGY